jgi:hypothetical protein
MEIYRGVGSGIILFEVMLILIVLCTASVEQSEFEDTEVGPRLIYEAGFLLKYFTWL